MKLSSPAMRIVKRYKPRADILTAAIPVSAARDDELASGTKRFNNPVE